MSFERLDGNVHVIYAFYRSELNIGKIDVTKPQTSFSVRRNYYFRLTIVPGNKQFSREIFF